MEEFLFKKGDWVVHITNTEIDMVVLNSWKSNEDNIYRCSWIDKIGQPQEHVFFEFELEFCANT